MSGFALPWMFLLLLFQLPMEIPVAEIPIFGVVTNLEISTGLLLAIYALYQGRRWASIRAASLTGPGAWILLWLGAMGISVLAAPDLRSHAFRFVVRAAAISTLFVVSRDLHQQEGERWALRTVRIIVLVAGLASLIACLEPVGWPPLESCLRLFRRIPTTVNGALRATGTFSHANQTGAFLAMALPGAFWLTVIGPRRARLGWSLPGALILWTLMGTLSRGAVVAAIMGIAAVAVLVPLPAGSTGRIPLGRSPLSRTRILLPLAGAILLLVARWVGDPAVRQRIGTASPRPLFGAGIEAPDSLRLPAGAKLGVPLRARNGGLLAWPSGGLEPVRLSSHIVRLGDGSPAFHGPLTPLPRGIAPGETIRMEARMEAPAEPGRYVILWDFLRGEVTWFSSLGSKAAVTRLQVLPGAGAPAASAAAAAPARTPSYEDLLRRIPADSLGTWDPVGRRRLWTVALGMARERPIFGWGADTFRLRSGARLGPGRRDPRLHANNLYLELLVTAGVLGLGAWLGLAASLLRALFAARGAFLPLAAGAAVFLVHGALDSFLGFYGIMGLFWILAGAASARRDGMLQSPTGG